MTIIVGSAALPTNVDRARLRRLLMLAVAAAAALVAGLPAADGQYARRAPGAGRTPYDGYWNVVIVTDVGACQRTYALPVQIVGGRVLSTGGARVTGNVGRGGGVVVRVSSGGSFATGSGKLGAGFGRGRWSGRGSTGFCGGRWQATRG